jgi:hypothetical protein
MNPTEQRFKDRFFSELAAARGKPGIGGMPLNFIERLGANMVTVSFSEPDPLSSRTEYYYNSRQNTLYKRDKFNKFYAVWHPVNTV